MAYCIDCGKKISRYFSRCNAYYDGLVCKDCDDKRVAKVIAEEVIESKRIGSKDLIDIFLETFRIYGKYCLKLCCLLAILLVCELLKEMISDGVNIPMAIAYSLGFIIIYTFVEGMIIYAVSEQYFKQEINISRAYHFALGKIKKLIIVNIEASIIIGIISITIIGIPLAIYFLISWSLRSQAILLEDLESRDALLRSESLINGNWWRIAGIAILLIIIGSVLGRIPLAGDVIKSAFTFSVLPIASTLLYYYLRVTKEGYSLGNLAGELHIVV